MKIDKVSQKSVFYQLLKFPKVVVWSKCFSNLKNLSKVKIFFKNFQVSYYNVLKSSQVFFEGSKFLSLQLKFSFNSNFQSLTHSLILFLVFQCHVFGVGWCNVFGLGIF